MSLKSEYGYWMQSHQMMRALGFRSGQHLPPEGFEPRVVQGVTFKCEPAAPKGGSRKHRIKYLCQCQMWVPFGRAGQHKCGARR